MTIATAPPIHIAILDDYSSSSRTHLSLLEPYISSSRIQITYLNPSKDHLPPSALTNLLQPYTIISTMRERTHFPREVLSALPNLKLLLTTGLRNAAVDVKAAENLGIIVAGTPGRSVVREEKEGKKSNYDTTNEQTWALILAVAKGVAELDRRIKVGNKWQEPRTEGGFGSATSLAGKTIGIIGLGRLGIQSALTAYHGFGMNVIAWSENLTQSKADEAALSRGLPAGTFKSVSKTELLQTADVVSVHYVLSPRSRNLLSASDLSLLKPSAILVNTSRGPLIDECALLSALRENKLRGVGLDVFDEEPLRKDSPWRSEEWSGRVVLSPHMGYANEETLDGWYKVTVENIRRWLREEDVENVLKAQ
ncbi:hypothetical protein HK097_011349 [Rhizophlyctis rosea]|uniref:Uncharacterized protein n=1 Tax=Rhizophlyctis rosea TaxID=64517 RepID=A0AAD5S6K9_9FUNG|nr:hypothetical protein HK097_011349 [Rhizophlyctis rosea]